MAVDKAMTASRRRLVYGLNVAVTIVLAIVLVGVLVWAAGAYGGRADLTRSGVNSLSPRTVQLLRGLDQDVTITGLYSTALKEVRPHAEKHKNRVSDLLDLYETAGRGTVTTNMIDASDSPNQVTTLLARLKKKSAYLDEAKPHAEALEAFPALSARLAELIQGELNEINGLRSTDPALADVRALSIIERNLQLMARGAQNTEADVQALEQDEIPRYGQAVDAVKDYLEQVKAVLQDAMDWMKTSGAGTPELAADAKSFFADAPNRYATALGELQALLKKTEDLAPVELEDVYETLKRGQTILVETEQEATVLSQDDVWPWRTDRNAPPPPDGDMRDFTGEQAVSSAILKLTQKTKTALIFTRFGGEALLTAPPPTNQMMMRMPQAPYGILNDLLQKENFITQEWDVQAQPDPPKVEEASRLIYVVFPPEPPPQQDPMRPAPTPRINAEQKQRIYDAVKEAGMAVFLTSWMPPSSQFMPTPEKYEFNEYLKSTWGVAVDDTHLALQFMVNPQRDGLMFPATRNLLIESQVFHYTDHPIGTPLRGLPAAFQALAPLRIVTGDEAPEGVTPEPVVEVNDTEDVWAIGNLARINEDLQKDQGTRRYDDDIPAPFPLSVAATDSEGRKLVVFASDGFVSDSVVNMAQMVMVGGALRLAKLYPGNTDLFVNALHWLTGNADRIAVGPQRGDVPRLDKLEEGSTLTFTRVFLVGIWPGVALLVGAGVWLLRRR
ncbi:MAG: GldG family protein [Planctomycetes bacterium]|nr:GldG family protein [Planctomycetota bacterium]